MPAHDDLDPLAVLRSFPTHDGSLASVLEARCEVRGDDTFLVFDDDSWSWTDFARCVDATAQMLVARGVARGDRVAVMAPNHVATVQIFFALARIGAVFVPLNPEFRVEEARYVLEHAEVSGIFCTSHLLEIARKALSARPAAWIALIDGDTRSVPVLSSLIDSAPQVELSDFGGAEDICLLLYTSGTTGFPKGVMHTQRNFVLAGEAFVERMHLQPSDRLLCVLPMFHINALFYSLGGAVAAGARLILAPRFSASGFWQLAAKTGATEVNLIAAVGNILVRRPRSEFCRDHRIKKVYGAPISPDLAEAFRAEFDVDVLIEGYGMTEVPGACNVPFEGPHVAGSMGRAARHPDPTIDFAQLRVVDDAGRGVPDGEIGELHVRTPIVMKGYYRDPDATKKAFRDDWFATGDLVRRDRDGFLFFVARSTDIIRRRGENISGAEIDRVVLSHPDVEMAASIAVAAELGEDEILVAVVPRNDARLAATDLANWCRERLAPGKVPRFIVFTDALPLTPTHRVAKFKLDRAALRAAAVDLAGED